VLFLQTLITKGLQMGVFRWIYFRCTLDKLTTRGLRKFVNKPGISNWKFVCLFFWKKPL